MKLIDIITNSLRAVGHSLITNKYEPQIKQKHDRDGNQYWQAYDSYNNKSYTFGSEQDVKVWLENRHY